MRNITYLLFGSLLFVSGTTVMAQQRKIYKKAAPHRTMQDKTRTVHVPNKNIPGATRANLPNTGNAKDKIPKNRKEVNVNINVDRSKDIHIHNTRNTVVNRNVHRAYITPPLRYGDRVFYSYHPYHYHGYRPYYWGPVWHPWGFFVAALATTAIIVSIENQQYHYDQGVYYIAGNGGYTVVQAPVGAVVTTLPEKTQTVVVNETTNNYYYGGAFYEKTDKGYKVVAPTAGTIVENLPEGGKEVKMGNVTYVLNEEFENIGVEVHHKAIEKITGSVYENAQLTRDFKNERYPNIVVTVDLLSTGIDIPSICNIVFMRRVRSRILYEQMLGRATRLCPEIGKEAFKVFDAVKLYDALKDYTQMQSVSNPSYSFAQLVDETDRITDEQRLHKQIEQIVAKLQRKSKILKTGQQEHIMLHTDGKSMSELIDELKNTDSTEIKGKVEKLSSLWNYLDTKVYRKHTQIFSTHPDSVKDVTRGYGNAEKPEDYIEGFKKFIEDNINTISAINVICNKPQELDRRSLKELKLLLDEKGYTEVALNTAWKSAKNVDIAADIIAYIRMLSIGVDLITPQERVKNAISKIKAGRTWNVHQLKWIDRFEKQLVAETILTRKDLDLKPFLDEGDLPESIKFLIMSWKV